jgi:hypothetical protein
MPGADSYLVANVHHGPDCHINSITGSLKACSSTEHSNRPGGTLRLRMTYQTASEEGEQSGGDYKL